MDKHENSMVGREECPDFDSLMAYADRRLGDDESERVAVHLASCCSCREYVRNYTELSKVPQTALPEDVRAQIRRAVESAMEKRMGNVLSIQWKTIAHAFEPTCEYLAAADGQSADQVQQEIAIKSGFIRFASKVPADDPNAWKVRLAIPIERTDKCRLRMQVEDAKGNPVEDGVLTLCGVELEVKGGRAYMGYRDFMKNLKLEMISLRRGSGEDIPGIPVETPATGRSGKGFEDEK